MNTLSFVPKHRSAPGDHQFVESVVEFIESLEIVGNVFETENEGEIVWQFPTPDEIGVCIQFHRDEVGEIFFRLETVLAKIDSFTEFRVLRYLAGLNLKLRFPFRVGADDTHVFVQCRSYCDGFTKEHFKLRLQSLLPFSREVQEELQRNFGLSTALSKRTVILK
ncbi:hypothetical protein WDW86_05540 [Bdellovibrionota bacterium FG-2]